jgi:hypothetical protein
MDVVFLVEFIENNGRHAELFRLQGKSPPELSGGTVLNDREGRVHIYHWAGSP